jgi:hypothetical protein
VVALATAVLALAACGGDEGYQDELVEVLAQELAENDQVAMSAASYTCIAEGVVDKLDPGSLEDRGVTPEGIFDEFASESLDGSLAGPELPRIVVPCLTVDDMAISLTELGGGVGVYQCAIGALGEDRTREILIESAESGLSPPEFDEAVEACRDSDPVESVAAGQESSISDLATSTTSTTTTVTPVPEFQDFALRMPPLVATWNVRLSSRDRLSAFGGVGNEGPRLPVAHLATVDAASAEVLDHERRQAIVDPSATIAAVYDEATAISPDRFRFVSLATGEDIDVVEFDSQGVGFQNFRLQWSPDGSAVTFDASGTSIFHRIGSGSFEYQRTGNFSHAFANSDLGSALAFCGPNRSAQFIIAEDGSVESEDLPGCRSMIQAVDANGMPYVLFLDRDYALHRIDAPQAARIVVPKAEGFPSALRTCNRVVVTTANQGESMIYEMSSGEWALTRGVSLNGCPVSDGDGRLVAYLTGTNSVHVIDLVTDTSNEVAVSGVPWAFSESGDELLVAGGGTFIVSTDGSGGAEASVTAVAARGHSFCRVGQLGLGLIQTETGVGILDIGNDSFTPLAMGNIGPQCLLSADAGWLLTNGHAISLEEEQAVALRGIDLGTGSWVREGNPIEGQVIADFLWSGSFETIVSMTLP